MKLTRNLVNKKGWLVGEKGENCTLEYDPASYRIKVAVRDKFVTIFPSFLSRIIKVPSLETMEEWMDQGIAKSITGKRVEPDGYGPDGSPSWLLVLGLI